jgi:Zn-dependent protease with chaperone function
MIDPFPTRFANTLKTTALLGALAGLLVLAGGPLAGQGGMLVALVLAAVLDLGAWWFSDTLALKANRAMPIQPAGLPAVEPRRRRFPGRGGARPVPTPAATAHLFTVSPLTADGLGSLFSTHPPIAKRVRRLRSWG